METISLSGIIPIKSKWGHWVRIRKSRFDNTWLVKLYPPNATYYFDFEESARTETFEQAILMANYFLGVK